MNNRNTHRAEGRKGWFTQLMGNVMLRGAGGLALVIVIAMFMDTGIAWWIWVIGLAICGGLAWIGDSMRTVTIPIDSETGQVKKRNL